MKDAYSFDTDEQSFKKEYKNMWNTYSKIFERMGLKTFVVESDNGYIGGDYCHEFVVEAKNGESRYLMSEDGSYLAHEDIAKFKKEEKNVNEELLPLQEVDAKRGTTMEDGVKLHKKPLWQQIKDVLFVDEKGRYILSIVRGDFDINETKLKHIIGSVELRHATDDEIRNQICSEPGFISPVGIKDIIKKSVKIIIVADDSLRTIHNAYGGANKKYKDLFNMNIDRDYKADLEGDIALAQPGFLSIDNKKLIEKQGIEVGNIFQLGYYYSKKMKNSTFIDRDGKEKPYYMGCYGIGIGRTMAAVIEVFHDDKGITWPDPVAPYQVHLVGLDLKDESIRSKVHKVYIELIEKGVDVLFDDRIEVTAGEKFADCDLIGIPIRLVVSKRTGDKIEYKKRQETHSTLITLDDILQSI